MVIFQWYAFKPLETWTNMEFCLHYICLDTHILLLNVVLHLVLCTMFSYFIWYSIYIMIFHLELSNADKTFSSGVSTVNVTSVCGVIHSWYLNYFFQTKTSSVVTVGRWAVGTHKGRWGVKWGPPGMGLRFPKRVGAGGGSPYVSVSLQQWTTRAGL